MIYSKKTTNILMKKQMNVSQTRTLFHNSEWIVFLSLDKSQWLWKDEVSHAVIVDLWIHSAWIQA